jgi:hypothetical protein
MIDYSKTLEKWVQLSHELHEPVTEEQYLTLLEFTQRLSDEHNVDLEPTKTLFWLACEYLRRWEVQHDPWAIQSVTTAPR